MKNRSLQKSISNTIHFVLCFIFLHLLLITPTLAQAASSNRLFLVGDGTLTIKNLARGTQVTATYLDKNGDFIEDAFIKIDQLMGFPTMQMKENMSRRMIGFLDYAQDRFSKSDKTIYIRSGYRSPRYNQSLRQQGRTAAKTSTHMDGMAIDFFMRGVDGKSMWNDLRALNCCGVGHYGGSTIHLDSGRPRFWEQATAQVNTDHSDHNKQIYFSTEYDRYKAGETIRSFFTSISDFGFGVKTKLKMIPVTESEKQKTKNTHQVSLLNSSNECHKINERQDARFLSLTLPEKIKPGRYQVQIDFCDRPFEDMPTEKMSNEIEILE